MTLSDKINRMIEFALNGAKITSASPDHVNTVFLLDEMDHSDLEVDIRDIVKEEISLTETKTAKDSEVSTIDKTATSSAIDKKVEGLDDTLTNLDEGLGDLANLSKTQIGNLSSFSKDPFKFMLANFFKRFAKGAGIIALATIIFAAVSLIISELMKPGRELDRRFKRLAKDEILLFNNLREQAELRQGFKTVIITTMPFLSGAEIAGQVSGNLHNNTRIPMDRIDPRRVIAPIISAQNSSRGSKFFNRRGRTR